MTNQVTIPSQIWYNLVIYDYTPLELKNSCHEFVGMDGESIEGTIREGIAYVDQRLEEGAYDGDDGNNPEYDLDNPKKEDLMEKKKILQGFLKELVE